MDMITIEESVISKIPTVRTPTFGGKPIDMPLDLYIPPEALEIFLEVFQGPLDLLLYLIRKHNIDILDIPVAQVTEQYIAYVEIMYSVRFDLAAEYLEMAAYLTEIKSRLLLPKPENIDGEESDLDPRAELVRRLQEYEQFRKAATDLDGLDRLERDLFLPHVDLPDFKAVRPQPEVDLAEVLHALKTTLMRIDLKAAHQIQREPLSVRAKMSEILEKLTSDFVEVSTVLNISEGRLGIVVTFLALLELLKSAMIELTQTEVFAPIYIRGIKE